MCLLYRDSLRQKHAQKKNFQQKLQEQVEEQKAIAAAQQTTAPASESEGVAGTNEHRLVAAYLIQARLQF